jgi:alkanesulfonate monooxygenase SsuD/methylene tetrahydromethanopterin reductase-like flavin-dependent oxidoreductase (luciferase family)
MAASPPVRVGLWYDLRNPSTTGRRTADVHRGSVEQIAWAEAIGFGSVWFTEHHFTDDGYCASPFTVAAATAMRTTTMRIGTNLVLLPLHDPIRVAEDAAAVSLLSDGRFDLGVAVGYRELEYRVFGRNIRHRPSLVTEGIDVIRQAWSGDFVAHRGPRFTVEGVRVTPVPDRPPRLLIGGMAEPAVRRAAELGDGFLSTADFTIGIYEAAAAELGVAPSVMAAQWAIVAEDPEREWAIVGDFALAQMNTYIGWGAFGPPDAVPLFPDRDALLASGLYACWTPAQAVEHLSALLVAHPSIEDVHMWAQLPGEPLDSGSARLQLMADRVIPALAALDRPAGARVG